MPCRLESWEIEYEEKLQAAHNNAFLDTVGGVYGAESEIIRLRSETEVLSAKVDNLREVVVALVFGNPEEKSVAMQQVDKIHKDQIRHREADIKRLKIALAKMKQTKSIQEKQKKLAEANPNFPLEPQLGFSPDKY